MSAKPITTLREASEEAMRRLRAAGFETSDHKGWESVQAWKEARALLVLIIALSVVLVAIIALWATGTLKG